MKKHVVLCLVLCFGWMAFPVPAYAYLVPLIGMIGALGGVAAVVLTALLSFVCLLFFRGKQLIQFLTGKKSADEEDEDETLQ